jgi:predicted extracellular nuclease
MRFRMMAPDGLEQIVIQSFGAQTEGQTYPSERPLRVFVGTGVPIWAIQGDGDISPYKLETLTTRGVVTGVFPELFGFWIQESDTDEDEATSAGLFVSRDELQEPFTLEDLTLPVSIGDWVEVSGQVREISQQTQIRLTDLGDAVVLARGMVLPPAINLDPPTNESESLLYYEALEGMLVSVEGPAIAVSPTSKYGETALVLPHHEVDRLWRDNPTGMMIMADDGSEMVHYDRSTLPYVIQTGDQVEGLRGPLAFTFGQYKIEPLDLPNVTTIAHELPSLPSLAEDELGLMTWNVENLFDILDPHPADLPYLRRADYDLALEKIANTILAAGAPTIVGLQEVEHVGILEDLAELPSMAEFGYLPFLIEGTDSRGIDVGYLVRGDRATVQSVEQYPAPDGLTSRPPLLVSVAVSYGGESETIYVLNNHFTSLSGGELATEPRRTAQAAWNAQVLGELLAADPGSHGVVLGDLNSYYDSPPLDTLRDSGLLHVYETLPPEERYTYIYQGISQTLDHILVTPEFMGRMLRVDVLRTNADFAPPIPGDDSPMRKSDHDALVVVFSLEP